MLQHHGKGSISKLLGQLFWRSPIFHTKQFVRNAQKAGFWKYGFRSHPSVKRKVLHFWSWWSLNRDMKEDRECPGWQFWYYELRVWHWGWKYYQDPVTKVWDQKWGVHEMTFRNFRKFPLIRSALERKANIEGKLTDVFLTRNEAYNASSPVQDSHTPNKIGA